MYMDTDLTEAEIQLLIALIELEHPIETPNNVHYAFYPKDLTEASRYFRRFLVDWSSAFRTLKAKGLILSAEDKHQLTETGAKQAERLRRDRPPIYYWYKDFYQVTRSSRANALLCERLYGRNLNQQGFMDMEQLQVMLDVLQLTPGSRVLDLGCGSGQISEYISDTTGAFVSGMDYIDEAILQASERTLSKKDRLEFKTGNLDHLDYPPASFDTILAIDTLYMPNDLADTLKQMKNILTPKGQMAIFYGHELSGDGPYDSLDLLPEKIPLGLALTEVGLIFQTWDFSMADYIHALRKRQIAEELKPLFINENNLFLYENRAGEAEGVKKAVDAGRAVRYLYHVTTA